MTAMADGVVTGRIGGIVARLHALHPRLIDLSLDRLIALLSGCIEAPEPVHVELGLDKMSNAGKHLALVSASYSNKDQVGALGILAPMRMHYERVITAVAFMAQFFSENEEGS